jgi:hypothetical protein
LNSGLFTKSQAFIPIPNNQQICGDLKITKEISSPDVIRKKWNEKEVNNTPNCQTLPPCNKLQLTLTRSAQNTKRESSKHLPIDVKELREQVKRLEEVIEVQKLKMNKFKF